MVSVVRAQVLTNFVDVAREFELAPYALMREHGLDLRALVEPERRVAAASVARLLERAAQRAGCPAFGVRMIESRSATAFGVISLLMAHEPSLREVLNTMVHYRHLLNEASVILLEEVGDLFILRHELLIDATFPAPQLCEMGLAMLTRIARTTLGAAWRPLQVDTSGPAPGDPSIYRRFFGVTPTFDSDTYRLVGRRADLDRVNPSADPSLALYARQVADTLPMARRGSTAHDVRTAIYQALQSGEPSLTWVAARVGQTPRTLQRRLMAEGASFSELTDEVRRALALRYLENPEYSILQIAEMLGYSQSSAFARWFAANFGRPASHYRRSRTSAG